MSLVSLSGSDSKTITMLGSMLFLRCVSGTRVVTGADYKEVAGFKFQGWGAHYCGYPVPYLTAAAAIGMRKSDVDLFIHRLDKVLGKLKGRSAPPTPTSVEELAVMRRAMRGGSSTVNGEGGSGGEQHSQSSASTSLASSKDSLRK
nr:unnamed protein product [Timema poppensis]